MSKHTPGPWVADIKADGSTEVWSADYSMFIAKRHQMNDRDEAKANAALIAAAPDLLEALERLVDAVNRNAVRQEDFPELRHAYEAIAAARGEG